LRLAIVTPWFGPELIGGAERLAWDISRALRRAGADVEVLATCCRSFHDDWAANYHRPGATTIDGVVLRRFRVDQRDRVAFSRANSALLALRREQLKRDRQPVPEAIADAFLSQGIHSRALVAHLQQQGARYDAVIFLPYLYGTTIDGLPVVADKAFLLPCTHDESYAYLDRFQTLFRQARGLLFNSEGELEVAADLYGPWVHARAQVIGHAVDAVESSPAQLSIKGFVPHRSRYILFLGRGDRTKNLEFAVDAFARFREQRRATALQFVVAGPHARHLRKVDGIVDLGAVTEEAKAALLAHMRALVMPSMNESFSRAVYEAWHARRPVVVHTACRATAQAVEDSGGGWIADTVDEWASIFATIDEGSDAFIDGLGQRGRAAAIEGGTWNDVAARTLAAIERRLGVAGDPAIEQFVPLGDEAVTAYAGSLADALRGLGRESTISIEGTQPQSDVKIVRHLKSEGAVSSADALIVHAGDVAIPADSIVFAASEAVADALSARGITNRLLPAPVDPGRWATASGEVRLPTGANDLLVCGRLDSANGETLLHVLALLRRRVRDARFLILDDAFDGISGCDILEKAAAAGLSEAVLIAESAAERYRALRSARVACAFGTLSDPKAIVDVLWFDLPIVAYEDTPWPDLVEGCGILVARDENNETSALLAILLRDEPLRSKLVLEGRRVRARFAPRAAAATLLDSLSRRSAAELSRKVSWRRP
jgi:glycosyltransferase involved in cell wall biosynthesis